MGRLSRYAWKRMLRLQASPHAVAVGVAVGVAISFTPLIGFHLLLAAAVAWALRGNVLAAWIATLVGNPWTFPFMWSASYMLGRVLLGHGAGPAGFEIGRVLADPVATLAPVFWPTTLGGLLLGSAIGAAVYYPLCRAIAAHRAHRARRMADARARRLAGGARSRVREERADAA
ncbi:MAG: hypothetical protein KatS3mg119_2404 [Rhodothalassiaceae bacterium]|nr:MAG: hypothetical protein KatS3mg119_2404 [Rhodothalassiaceae bacterium]